MADSLADLYRNQNTRKPRGDSKRGTRMIKGAILILGILLVVQIGYFGFVVPRLTITQVHIQGLYGLTEQEILSAGGIVPGLVYQQVDIRQIESGILLLPQIKGVEVAKIFPNRLTIQLTHREPMAWVQVQGQFMAIDNDGVLFSHLGQGYHDAPVLTGLTFEDHRGIPRIPYRYRVFIQDLHTLQLHDPALFRVFSQFVFEPLEPGGFQVYVYPVHIQQRVLIGDRLSREQGVALLRVLELLRHREDFTLVREIDFRTDDVVFTLAGGGS